MTGTLTAATPTLDPTIAWDALVIGGGATGAGLLRDLARRGMRTLLVDRSDLGTGTSGRYHGLLHSGGRYVAKDPNAARECIVENRVLRRIAPFAIEDTGGYFVATPDDPDDYVDAFREKCAASDVDCAEIDVAELLRRIPTLNPRIRRAFAVPDGAVEPWSLIDGNVADAAALGSHAVPYHRVVGFDKSGERILAAHIEDVRSGTVYRVMVNQVVSAAGAWGGQIAAMAGATVKMAPGKGTMLVFNQRMTDAVVNRCHKPGDGDIMVPVGSVAILGTTDIHVNDPDEWEITRAEVDTLLDEGAKLFPNLRAMRLLRAYGGVRPLYDPGETGHESRDVTRAHVVLDHAPRDGVSNFTSIVGGKLTTYRLMAQDTADVVCRKAGVTTPVSTADEPIPGGEHGQRYHWLGGRFAEHESHGGGDAALICECELVTRSMLEEVLDRRWPCSLDDVRRSTRLGMGPCQGGFCTFRAAGAVADHAAAVAADSSDVAAAADAAMADFIRERQRGTQPIAHGRQLQEALITAGFQWGTLGLDSLVAPGGTRDADG
ncbi:MAG TPA: anaerobic glycerol-3-phosphate dehydrogenase subunit GlpA [Clostridia bacterium]|nr:anaerobic glycerol-3-phosphate dehydrogenase subunit GlpA [Clostridia bacterium]